MKILIVSDSHSLTEELSLIKEKHAMELDFMIHCGDSELAANDSWLAGFTVVRGNCDFDENFPEDVVVNAGNHKIFVTHGHRYSVKSTLMNICYRARELDASIVCFGHSHSLGAEMIDNTLFINPGSIKHPRGRMEKTYVILEIENDDIHLRVFEIGNGEICGLAQKFSLPKKV